MATLTDVVVRDNRGQESDDRFGRGIGVGYGGQLALTRVLMERTRNSGASALDPETTLTLADLVVRDTDGQLSDRSQGVGLTVQSGAAAVLSRTAVVRSRGVGVLVHDGAAMTSNDLVVRDTESTETDGRGGRGIAFQLDSRAELTTTLVERNRDVGVGAGAAAQASFVDAAVLGTRAPACADAGCPRAPGIGVGAYERAALSMTRFVIAQGETCGLHLARNGQIDLQSGEVRDSPIGLCLQVDGYPLDRLMNDVRFVGNELNLDATSLPIPEAVEPLAPAP